MEQNNEEMKAKLTMLDTLDEGRKIYADKRTEKIVDWFLIALASGVVIGLLDIYVIQPIVTLFTRS